MKPIHLIPLARLERERAGAEPGLDMLEHLAAGAGPHLPHALP